MQIEYRPASLEDLGEICKIIQDAINLMVSKNILQWDELYPTREDFFEDIMKKQLFLGMIDEKIAVVYALNQEFEEAYRTGKWKYEDRTYYVIHRFCVNPIFQNKGVGRAAMLHIEEELRSMGIEAIRLDTFTRNPYSLRMYDHLGFSKVGTVTWRKGDFYLLEKYLVG